MGYERATPLLKRVVIEDQSPTVRRLAQEALRKIDGELPFEHQKQLAAQQDPHAPVPTDQKLANLREIDQKLQNQER
jgi:hypothetical protein